MMAVMDRWDNKCSTVEPDAVPALLLTIVTTPTSRDHSVKVRVNKTSE